MMVMMKMDKVCMCLYSKGGIQVVGSSTYKIGECNAEERILCKESMTSYPCTRPPCFHWRPVDKATIDKALAVSL